MRISERLSAAAGVGLFSFCMMTGVIAAEGVFPGREWETADAEEVGMKAEKLQAFVDKASASIKAAGAIVRDGRMVAHWGDISTPISWTSAWKPQNSYCLFFCIQEGVLGGVDDSVAPFVAEAYPGRTLIEKDRGMTFRHLANQISGYSFVEKPGESFSYNDAATSTASNLLSAAVSRVYPGKSLRSYLSDKLSPLQLQDGLSSWMSVRDQCRIAWWRCNEGAWNGEQILAERFFDTYARPLVPREMPHSTGEDPHGAYLSNIGSTSGYDAQGIYGFWWWFNNREFIDTTLRQGRIEHFFEGLPNDAYAAYGYGNNYVIVMPRLRIVAAFNPYAGEPGVWSILMDAVDGVDRTPPDTPAPPRADLAPSGGVRLTWDAVRDADGEVDAYWVYRNGAFLAEIEAAQNSYVDQSVNPNQSYSYEIQAFNTSGFAGALSRAQTISVPEDAVAVQAVQLYKDEHTDTAPVRIRISGGVLSVRGQTVRRATIHDCRGRILTTVTKHDGGSIPIPSAAEGLYFADLEIGHSKVYRFCPRLSDSQ
jgi:hypothetical protein